MSVVRVQDLSKTYQVADKTPGLMGTMRHFVARKHREIKAVKGVSFEIQPGEVVGFLGPNGAGKTTTLKMLTGLVHPTGGSAEVLGHTPFDRKRELLRRITLVMGNKQQLIWDLPAGDSFLINAAVYDIPDAEAKRRVAELSELLELEGKLKQPVRKLSLGERMKCELVAALLHQPKVLFLDEPTLGLDVNAQSAVRRFLREYNQKHGAAILLTSHYMADITALCDRVIVIHHGSIMYDGKLDALTQRFAPFREVKLELAEPAGDRDFARFGEVEAVEGREVRLLVQRDSLPATVNRVLSEVQVSDLTVTDPPIEEVIARVFEAGNGSGGSAAGGAGA